MMKKVKLIYNPNAGESLIVEKLDDILRIHQKAGYIVCPVRLDESFDMRRALEDIGKGYSHVIVAGGDGTVDVLVNELMRMKVDIPIGILPTGTANDYSKYIGIPMDITQACIQMLAKKPLRMDLGKINDRYFVNVASAGLFSDVSMKTDSDAKNSIGKLAYYLKGIESLPNFKKIPVRITSEHGNYAGDMYMVLIFNGRTAGNIDLAYRAQGNDGMLDVILIKGEPILEMFPLLIKFLRGEHLEEPRGLLYFQTDEILIESPDPTLVSDIDGELGPGFPLRISCVSDAITVLGVSEESLKAKRKFMDWGIGSLMGK